MNLDTKNANDTKQNNCAITLQKYGKENSVNALKTEISTSFFSPANQNVDINQSTIKIIFTNIVVEIERFNSRKIFNFK